LEGGEMKRVIDTVKTLKFEKQKVATLEEFGVELHSLCTAKNMIEHRIDEALKYFIHSSKPELMWVEGKYEGRKAKILRVFCEYDRKLTKVFMRVKTEKKDGKGYLDDNDLFHRSYHRLGQDIKLL
jgi:hypothetical protein